MYALGRCEYVLNYLVHCNHYQQLGHVISEQQSLQSSHNREKRSHEYGEIFNISDAKNLLGDQENRSFPIFRFASETDVNTVTLCTAHFDFHSSQLLIYEDNPKENNQAAFIYNLSELVI
jgi:hypothetical protein